MNQRLVDVICDKFVIDPDELDSETRFCEDLGADSLDAVELVMMVEEEFGIEIPDEDSEKIKTAGQLEAYLKGKGVLDEVVSQQDADEAR